MQNSTRYHIGPGLSERLAAIFLQALVVYWDILSSICYNAVTLLPILLLRKLSFLILEQQCGYIGILNLYCISSSQHTYATNAGDVKEHTRRPMRNFPFYNK